jgi:hypothetical protein
MSDSQIAPGVQATAPEAPAEPEYKSETLYIQNLNEKVKVEGNILSTGAISL